VPAAARRLRRTERLHSAQPAPHLHRHFRHRQIAEGFGNLAGVREFGAFQGSASAPVLVEQIGHQQKDAVRDVGNRTERRTRKFIESPGDLLWQLTIEPQVPTPHSGEEVIESFCVAAASLGEHLESF
jgi:hypothetical protein